MNRFENTLYWYFQNQAVRRMNRLIREDFGEDAPQYSLKESGTPWTPSKLMDHLQTEKKLSKYTSQILECMEYYREITPEKISKWASIQEALQANNVYTYLHSNHDGDTVLSVNGSDAEIFLWRGPKSANRRKAGKLPVPGLIREGQQILDLNSNTSDTKEIAAAVLYFLGYAPERLDGKGVIGETPEVGIKEEDGHLSVSYGIGITGKTITLQDYRKELPEYTEETAREKLYGFLTSAKTNFEQAVNLESLVKAAEENSGGTFFRHPNEDVRALQDHFWEILTGTDRPFTERVTECRTTLMKQTEKDFGSLPEKESWDDTFPVFNAVETAEWMECHEGTAERLETLKRVMRALRLRASDITGRKLQNELVYFDETTARSLMEEQNSAFMNDVSRCVRDAIRSSSGSLLSLDVDAQGIIRYRAERSSAEGREPETITGYLGQIFEPDPENGSIRTAFAAENKYLLVPGYTAAVIPPEDLQNEYGTLGSRTRLIGYEQILFQTIRRQLRKDLFRKTETADSRTVLNSIYSNLMVSRHEPDYLDNITNETDRILRNAVVKTERGMVRYSNNLRDEAGILSEDKENYWKTVLGKEKTISVDGVSQDVWYDISLLSDTTSGYFDLIATGSGQNQGVIRFLAEGAEADPETQKIIPTEKDRHCALLELPWLRYLDNSPFDRQQMVFSNLRTAYHVSEPVGMAQMTFGGWNFDDGFVVSKTFAESCRVPVTERDDSGNAVKRKHIKYRPLQVGDKICDFAGNKGVITLIVDPEITDEAADKADPAGSYRTAAEWFRVNPNLQVIGAPFTAPSRLNGGSALECRERSEDLVKPDGEHVPDALGYARFIITHYTADAKTKPYINLRVSEEPDDTSDPAIAETGLDEEFNSPGVGRRVSAQLAWGLAAVGAKNVLHEFYGNNDARLIELRELLILLGLDLDETGKLCVGYHPHKEEPKRRIIRVPEDDWDVTYTRQEKIDLMMSEIAQHGGFLQLPFEMDYPLPAAKDVRQAYRSAQPKEQQNLLPVLSVELRKAFMNSQDQMQRSEYTRYYQRIVQNLVAAEETERKERKEQYYERIRRIYRRLVNDVLNKRINAKDNVFKDSIMSSVAPISATAVWSADPTLNIDEVAVSKDLKERLGLRAYTEQGVSVSESHLLLWRDPILRSGGIRYMKVVEGKEGMTGIAVNPFADKSFDGDFDGDTIGVVRLQDRYASDGEYASKDAEEKLSHWANLLDIGAGRNSEGMYSLFFNHSLDFKAVENERAAAGDDSLKMNYEAITARANAVYEEYRKTGDKEAYRSGANAVLEELNEYVRQIFADDFGRNIIQYDHDLKNHMASVYRMTDKGNGAKGKAASLKEYIYYLGYEGGDLETGVFDDLRLRSDPSETERSVYLEKLSETEYATAVKSFGTGVAGAFSQRGVAVLRNKCPAAVTELTYPVTQAVLQAKHNSKRARVLLDTISNECRKLWKGSYAEKKNDPAFTADEWINEFLQLYRSEQKLNVGNINEEYIRTVADCLKDENGRMRSIEEYKVAEELGSPLDILAYLTKMSTYEMLVKFALEGKELFSGMYTSLFCPDSLLTGNGFWAEDSTEG